MDAAADDRRKPYEQVADRLRAQIQQGRYSPGDQLPNVADLAGQHGVAKATMQRAIEVLRQEGYVVAWHGRGTFVHTDQPSAASNVATLHAAGDQSRAIEQLRDEVESLRRQYGRLEALLLDLYSRTGHPFPHQAPEQSQSRTRAAGA